MKNFVFVYHSGAMPSDVTPEDMEKIKKAWMDWFQELGDKLVDGGNPFGEKRAVDKSGVADVRNPASGYSIVKADNMDAALEIAKGCPLLNDPGEPQVEVYETMPM